MEADMSLRMSEELIASTETPHVAWWNPDAAADGRGAWVVSWLPQRLLTKEQALAAMMVADTVAKGATPYDQRDIESWAAELGLTVPEAVARLTGE
jgi:hypothetical protein